jgi:hypothetical protein
LSSSKIIKSVEKYLTRIAWIKAREIILITAIIAVEFTAYNTTITIPVSEWPTDRGGVIIKCISAGINGHRGGMWRCRNIFMTGSHCSAESQ